MMLRSRFSARTAFLTLALCAAAPLVAPAQPKPAAPVPVVIPTSDELLDLREQLVSLVRMSPTLMQAIEVDPSLLADEEYVSRTNPQLAQFLAQHPEIARNPDFYLFAQINGRNSRGVQPLRRAGAPRELSGINEIELRRQYVVNASLVLVFAGSIGGLLWLIRLLLENRRWSRAFRQQTEIHGKLIDRFATNQELLDYMNTEPGRRFLEASPIPVGLDRNVPLPGGMSRVIGPLQIGIVLTMLGGGLMILARHLREFDAPLTLFGMVTLMPGLGFIISAIVTWRLTERLGLTPQSAATSDDRQ